ncbi:phage tail assembly chaperone [Burkholderia orbicola]|uniref:phage tail assembly chaperone n=1 Tax=Burkholderia orbicola TaxID=2978683 RepID=UPI002FE25C68
MRQSVLPFEVPRDERLDRTGFDRVPVERLRALDRLLADLEEAGGTEAQGTAPPAPEADRSRELLTLVDAIAPVLQPFADALAGLKDEDAEYVFGTCLSVVERWQGAGWAKVWNTAHKTSMFDDIGIDVMLPLVVRVVVANLGPFISGLLTSQASSPAAT